MQVGTITMSGRVIGTITVTTGAPDAFPADAEETLSGHPAGFEPTGHHAGQHRATPAHHDSIHHRTSEDAGAIPYGASGSGNPFDRTRFAQELQEKPWLREKMAHISLGENQDPRANTAVLETMMNRATVRGTSLEAQARRHRSSGVDERGYYSGWAPTISADKRAMFDRNLANVLAGSNISNYATDNSSGDLAARERASGAFRHHATINGESFFSPGNAEPAFRDRWRELNRKAAEMETAAAKPPDDL